MQAVGQVARFQAAPNESHVLAVKRIFRYLKGTKEFRLMTDEAPVEKNSTWVSV
jgi:hypothetical protein